MVTDELDKRRTLGSRVLWIALFAICGGVFFASAGAPAMSREPEGYYNLQTAGFLKGHLYAAVEPHPGLLALPDPYDPIANALYRMHDMTYWQGKYYLYFGVAPILLLFLPWHVVTGQFLSEPTAVALFLSIGAIAAGMFVLTVRRHFFPRASTTLVALLVVVQALASPTLLLSQMPQFYQVPISCAYALLMVAFACVAKVFVAPDERGRGRWLWAAGSAWGLTLAARPNYLLSPLMLAVVLWWCLRDRGGWHAPKPLLYRWAIRAFGPAVVIGLGLMWYNWARFGQPTEFGMRYQLAGDSFVNFTPLSLKYLPPHAASYLAEAVTWMPYFPFVDIATPDSPFGVVRYLPMIWLSLGLVAFAFPTSQMRAAPLWLGLTIGGAAVANLVMNAVFFFQPLTRYLCDFTPSLILVGTFGAMVLVQRHRGLVPIAWLAGLASVLFTAAIFVHRLSPAAFPTRMATAVNRVVGQFERWRGRKFGALKLRVELPAKMKPGQVEPLLQTGLRPDRRDWVNLHCLDDGRLQLGYGHAGVAELVGEPFATPASRQFELLVESGALLPPIEHPFFNGWTRQEIVDRRRTVRLSVDGHTVLTVALESYGTRAEDVLLGIAGFKGDTVREKFSGRVTLLGEVDVARGGVPATEMDVRRPLRALVQFPADKPTGYEPLICAGERGQGELLFVIYHPGNRVQFALDSWGRGATYSKVVEIDPRRAHELQVWLGAWARRTDVANAGDPKRLFVSLDGQPILDVTRDFYPAGAVTALGRNRIGAGSAGPEFTGRILAVESMAFAQLPAHLSEGRFGMIDWTGMLSRESIGRTEPFVATGEGGAGDLLFVRYLDAEHVAFGLDHWGVGGPVSAPVRVSFTRPVHIEVEMGSLRERATAEQARRVRVRVDGREVFVATSDLYPARADQIVFGLNSIGASSASPQFSGQTRSLLRPLDLP